MGSTFNDLPEELLLIIFLLHPMKTLVLFTSVCKLWRRIISSNDFIQLFLSQQRTSTNTNKYFLLQDASKSKILVDGETLIYHNIFGKKYKCYGICDGLFCLSEDSSKAHSKIILWNPVFRRKLPPLKKIKHSHHTQLLFGYHDDDYKVLKFIFISRKCYVCIYSLSTNDWNVLEYDNFFYSSSTSRYLKARLVNGSAYLLEYFTKYDCKIISFDLSCEKFREIKLPVDFWYNGSFIMEEYRESLALIGRVLREAERVVVVVVMWVLRVNDDKSFSWDEMLFTKQEDDYAYNADQMGFINKDEVVMWSGISGTVGFLYNVKNECGYKFTTQEAGGTIVVQPSSNVQYCVREGLVARPGDLNELRMYMILPCEPYWKPRQPKMKPRQPKMKEVALTSTSNAYGVLADSNSNRYDVFADSDEEDIWSGY